MVLKRVVAEKQPETFRSYPVPPVAGSTRAFLMIDYCLVLLFPLPRQEGQPQDRFAFHCLTTVMGGLTVEEEP